MGYDLSIAIASPVLYPGDKSRNLDIIEHVLENKSVSTAELFVFPEANIIGGLWKDGNKYYKQLAEEVPEGDSCQKICELAKQKRKLICCGIIEKCGGQFFITHFICGPDGFI